MMNHLTENSQLFLIVLKSLKIGKKVKIENCLKPQYMKTFKESVICGKKIK